MRAIYISCLPQATVSRPRFLMAPWLANHVKIAHCLVTLSYEVIVPFSQALLHASSPNLEVQLQSMDAWNTASRCNVVQVCIGLKFGRKTINIATMTPTPDCFWHRVEFSICPLQASRLFGQLWIELCNSNCIFTKPAWKDETAKKTMFGCVDLVFPSVLV